MEFCSVICNIKGIQLINASSIVQIIQGQENRSITKMMSGIKKDRNFTGSQFGLIIIHDQWIETNLLARSDDVLKPQERTKTVFESWKKGLLHGVSILRSFTVSSFKAALSQARD